MHVALYSPAWPPATNANGIVTYTHWMREGLRAQGHHVSIFCGGADAPADDADVHRVAQTPSDRLAQWLSLRVLGRAPSIYDASRIIARAMRAVHRRRAIDVIDMEESFGWAADIEQSVGVPVVVKLHGPAFFNLGDGLLRTEAGQEKVRREGEALAHCAALIAPARYTLDVTLERYHLHPAIAEHVVNPLSLPADSPIWDATRCGPKRILFVGRFDFHKGGDIVVRALNELLAGGRDVELVFVGPDAGLLQADGSTIHLHDYLASFPEPRMASALTYRGRLSRSEIADLRVSAAVTVVASRYENQAYTLLEAMLQGCPVVCTDNTGSSECVDHGVTGLLARTEDPIDLAKQIAILLDDPARAGALGAAARAEVLRRHSPERVAAQTLSVYRRAIERQRTSGATHAALVER